MVVGADAIDITDDVMAELTNEQMQIIMVNNIWKGDRVS